MLYDILMALPLLAIASCLALFVSVVVILTNNPLPRASGFVIRERRKINRTLAARTPVAQPPSGAVRQIIGARV